MFCRFFFDILAVIFKEEDIIKEEEEEAIINPLAVIFKEEDKHIRDLCIEYWVEKKAIAERGTDVKLTFACEMQIQMLKKT